MEGKKDQPTTIDDYIAQFPQDVQKILNNLRSVIHESAPQGAQIESKMKW